MKGGVNLMRKTIVALFAGFVGFLGFTGIASATAPTPPSETDLATNILGTFGDKLFDVVTALATNVWVLAIFGMGIAFAVIKGVLSSGKNKAQRALPR